MGTDTPHQSPPTFLEAQAIAREYLSEQVEWWGGCTADEHLLIHLLVQVEALEGEAREQACDQAALLAGLHPLAFDHARVLAAGRLRRGEHLPPGMAAWAADVLQGLEVRPKRPRPGPDPLKTLFRDRAIVRAVRLLESAGYRPLVRQECSEAVSACDAVAQATHQVDGISGMTFESVRKAWQRGYARA